MSKIISRIGMGVILISALAFASCNKTDDSDNPILPVSYERGDILKTTSLGILPAFEIQQILQASNVEVPFDLEYPVEVISVNYSTIDGNGNQITVSGAAFIPKGLGNMPMLSIQHGTETKRDYVASVGPDNSVEGIIGMITASMGYFTVVPDYPGFGVSQVMHPYLLAESLVPSVIDFMRAGKKLSSEMQITLDDYIFLTGYSEGGYMTLAAQKTLEEEHSNEFNLTAVAPLAGPYDLKGMFDTAFISGSYVSNAYVAYFLTAYNEYYGWNRLDDFFYTPYAGKMTGLFDGTKTWAEVTNQLPETLPELVRSEFIQDYKNFNEPNVISALEENTLFNWVPQAPVHFFHGDADSIVPFQNAITAMEKFTANGAKNLQLTAIPGGTHETAGAAAIFGALDWFQSFLESKSHQPVNQMDREFMEQGLRLR